MKVRLDKNLLDYMHEEQKTNLMLKLEHDDFSGYNANAKHPRITYHRPKHTKGYDAFTVDDITVYIEKGIQPQNDELLFVDEKFMGIHRCQVLGMQVGDQNRR